MYCWTYISLCNKVLYLLQYSEGFGSQAALHRRIHLRLPRIYSRNIKYYLCTVANTLIKKQANIVRTQISVSNNSLYFPLPSEKMAISLNRRAARLPYFSWQRPRFDHKIELVGRLILLANNFVGVQVLDNVGHSRRMCEC